MILSIIKVINLHVINRHPTRTLNFQTPYFALYSFSPSYHRLSVFGCKCYPNLSATTPHKLAPRFTLCVFLGYPSDHNGYRCVDLATNRLIISRHVTFDESSFPFAELPAPLPSSNLDFFCRSLTMCLALFLHQLLQVQELQV